LVQEKRAGPFFSAFAPFFSPFMQRPLHGRCF
jgi:hypothetical protein